MWRRGSLPPSGVWTGESRCINLVKLQGRRLYRSDTRLVAAASLCKLWFCARWCHMWRQTIRVAVTVETLTRVSCVGEELLLNNSKNRAPKNNTVLLFQENQARLCFCIFIFYVLFSFFYFLLWFTVGFFKVLFCHCIIRPEGVESTRLKLRHTFTITSAKTTRFDEICRTRQDKIW